MEEFSQFSGLYPSPSKSLCFLANVLSPHAEQIVYTLGFNSGQLPIKLLGVPLISSKLTHLDCFKVSYWTSLFLSYSGRLQLNKSVLFAIQSFWAARLIIPKAILKEIQQILCRFLWKGSLLAKSSAIVAWRQVAMPY